MSTLHLVDSELVPLAEGFPVLNLNAERLPIIRDMLAGMIQLSDPSEYGATRQEVTIPGDDTRCLLYAPQMIKGPLPILLHFHGGGYVLGAPEDCDAQSLRIVFALGIMVLSVDYKLAPENVYPSAVDQTYGVLRWIHQNADALGVDPSRVAVGGDSAGGGLAASLVLKACQEGEYPIAFQHLVYPMLDPSTKATEGLGAFIWTAEDNAYGWQSYLGSHDPACPSLPINAPDLSGLPPTWIGIGDLDLFLPENQAFASRLEAAGVSVEMKTYVGGIHGFPGAKGTEISERFYSDYLRALKAGLE